MNNEPKVATVVVNFNGLEDTLECLSSLEHVAYAAHEIIVIDNASDNQKMAIDELRRRFPSVYVIANTKNVGFGGGMNIGISRALERGAEYVFLLNNDATVAPDALTVLVQAMEADKQIGIAGPHIYYAKEPNMLWYAGGLFTWRGGGRHIGEGLTDATFTDSMVRDTEYMTGCALLIRRETLEKIGLLPEMYFMYYEDIEWSLLAKRAGYRVVVAGRARVWHKVSQTAQKMGTPTRHYYDIRNRLLLAKRNAPIHSRIAIYAWSLFFYAKQMVKIALFPSTRAISRSIMHGIGDYYSGKFGKL